MRGLRVGSWIFAPRLVPSLAALPLLALFLWAGHWQLERAAEKRAQIAAFGSATVAPQPLLSIDQTLARYTRVSVSGRYLPHRQILLDSMTHDGTAGYRVLTPLETNSGFILLVDRGWIAGTSNRALLPDIAVADTERTVTGLLDELPRAGLASRPDAGAGWPRLLNYPTLPTVQTALGRETYPKILLLDAGLADGYVRDWRPSGFPPERHLGYAVQWFALAATLAGLYLYFSFHRDRST